MTSQTGSPDQGRTDMAGDMARQPGELAAGRDTLRAAVSLDRASVQALRIIGCGDSYFAGLALGSAIRDAGLPCRAQTALEAATDDTPGKGDLAVFVSISGGTKRTVHAARKAAGNGAATLAITCGRNSDLARVCDTLLVLPYEPGPRYTPHALDYTMSLLALAVAAEAVLGQRFDSLATIDTVCANALSRLSPALDELAAGWRPETRLFTFGGGPDLGTAHYLAAKLHECGGLPALSAESENMVHGMNFMLEPSDVLVGFAGPHPSGFRALETAGALSAIAPACLVVPDGLTAPTGVEVIEAPGDTDLSFAFGAGVMAQRLTLAIAEKLDLALAEPRAGRSLGDRHMAAQTRAMKETGAE